MPSFKLHINGNTHVIDTDFDMPLLWVLRDLLGLMGTKYGCGIGQCGTCTVHVDDRAVRSCMLPVSALGSSQVRTIEGLAVAGGNALINAWLAEQVSQCGYCQSGQIMAAAALLMENPNPSNKDIDNRMAGNLCRCGTYPRIREAIKKAAEKSNSDGGAA